MVHMNVGPGAPRLASHLGRFGLLPLSYKVRKVAKKCRPSKFFASCRENLIPKRAPESGPFGCSRLRSAFSLGRFVPPWRCNLVKRFHLYEPPDSVAISWSEFAAFVFYELSQEAFRQGMFSMVFRGKSSKGESAAAASRSTSCRSGQLAPARASCSRSRRGVTRTRRSAPRRSFSSANATSDARRSRRSRCSVVVIWPQNRGAARHGRAR